MQLEQAARIDGATRFQAFLLVMPLSAPGIIATAIYSFMRVERVHLRLHLPQQQGPADAAGRHPALLLGKHDGLSGPDGGRFMMSVPVVVLFLVLQRYFVRALTEGAVKA